MNEVKLVRSSGFDEKAAKQFEKLENFREFSQLSQIRSILEISILSCYLRKIEDFPGPVFDAFQINLSTFGPRNHSAKCN